MKHLFFSTIGLAFLSSGQAATLRVPQDYSTVQRAAIVANAGDTIEIAEGNYYENVAIIKPLVIKGAGRDKTTLTGQLRDQPVLGARTQGKTVVENITLAHGAPLPERPVDPNSDEPPIESSANVLESRSDETVLRNVQITHSSGTGIQVVGGLLILRGVTISDCTFRALAIESLRKGSIVEELVVSDIQGGHAVVQFGGVADYRQLDFSELGDAASGPVLVSGPTSIARFADLDERTLRKIAWEDNASPDGKAQPAAPEDSNPDMEEWKRREAATHQRTLAVTNRLADATKSLQSTVDPHLDAANAANVLGQYFEQILKDYSTDDWFFGEPQIIKSEVRYYFLRYGARALEAAFQQWPHPPSADNPAAFYRSLSASDIDVGIASVEGENWLKEHTAEIEPLVGAWRKVTSGTPARRAAAFVAMVDEVSDYRFKSELPPEAIDLPFQKLILAEVPAFIESAGFPALQELLRQLAENETRLVTAKLVQSSLTTQQKRELFKLLRGHK